MSGEKLGRFIRVVIAINVGMSLLMGAVVIAVTCAFQEDRLDRLVSGVVFGVMMAGYATIFTVRGVRKARRQWQNYRLVMADEGLIRFSAPESPITVLRTAVRLITEEHDTWRLKLGVTHFDVPKRIEQPERIRERLGAWQTIQGQERSGARFIYTMVAGVLAPVAVLGGVAIGDHSDDMRVKGACALLATAAGLRMAVYAWRSLTMPRWTKICMPILLVFPLRLLVQVARLIFQW